MTDRFAFQKVTLNLWAQDIETLRRRYGYGWSTEVRDIVHRHLKRLDQTDAERRNIPHEQ